MQALSVFDPFVVQRMSLIRQLQTANCEPALKLKGLAKFDFQALAVGCCQEGHPSVKSMPNLKSRPGYLANCRPRAPTSSSLLLLSAAPIQGSPRVFSNIRTQDLAVFYAGCPS